MTYLERVGCDGSGEDFYLYSSACFSVLTEADAIFCREIKEGRCKWVKEETECWETWVVSSDFIVHYRLKMHYRLKWGHTGLRMFPQSKKWSPWRALWCKYSVTLPTCPEEANRLMVVRSIQPRLASSLWFTSRNWTIARLAASGEANTHAHAHTHIHG